MKITKEILVLKTNSLFEILLEVEIVEAETANLYSLTSTKINTMITGEFYTLKDAKEWFANTIMKKLVFWQNQKTLLSNLQTLGFSLKPSVEHMKKYSETGSFGVLEKPKDSQTQELQPIPEIEFKNFKWEDAHNQFSLN